MCEEKHECDRANLPTLLPIYYDRLFPYELFYRWLSYGNIDSRHFSNREFSFTLKDDIYLRYLSFNTQNELEESVKSHNPYKIDIGAIFSLPASNCKQVGCIVEPIERELVFDIDLTDYDEIRTCCDGANVCVKCWKFMALACKIIHAILKDDFGFKHILWVFSGRRGIHCWVCDDSAKSLTEQERDAVADYIQLVPGKADLDKRVNLSEWQEELHPSIRRALEFTKECFTDLCITEQRLLDDEKAVKKLMDFIPEEDLKTLIEQEIASHETGIARWTAIQKLLKSNDSLENNWLLEEIMLQCSYPRLDINVTKSLNHLLKAPFCIHPETGKVCVPFNPETVDEFDPTNVPVLHNLIKEVNELDTAKNPSNVSQGGKIHSQNYRVPSLYKSIEVFKKFVEHLEETCKQKYEEIEDEFMNDQGSGAFE